jgi:hypothetical protein
MCGKDYALNFTFMSGTTLYSNTPKWTLYNSHLSMETDITRFLKGSSLEYASKWYDYIKGARAQCFGESVGHLYKEEKVILDGLEYQVVCEHGGAVAGRYVDGLCEGMLRAGSSCGSEDNDPWKSTGHIWIDPNIADQCEPFESPQYLGNCSFSKDQTIYIWTDVDISYPFSAEEVYCPELVICSNP